MYELLYQLDELALWAAGRTWHALHYTIGRGADPGTWHYHTSVTL